MLRLDEICLFADELDPAVADLEAVFCITTYYHGAAVEKFGLVIAQLPDGNNFLKGASPSGRRRGCPISSDTVTVCGIRFRMI